MNNCFAVYKCVLVPLDEPDLGCQRVASLVMRLAKVVDSGESSKGFRLPVLSTNVEGVSQIPRPLLTSRLIKTTFTFNTGV